MPSSTKPRKAGSASAGGSSSKKASSQPQARVTHGIAKRAGTVLKGAAAATLGTAAAAAAVRVAIASRTRRKRVLGVQIPRRHSTMKSVARQLADLAETVEQSSADVSKASGRAKHAAKALS